MASDDALTASIDDESEASMPTVEIPTDEPARLRALASLEVLDTSNDEVLDGLVRTAASVIGCPVSAISLVDERRQWFKARVGLELEETSRDIAFCAHAILQDGIFEVRDCRQDSRFAENPLVTGPPQFRFYAGIPIRIDGENVGVFCIMDHVPRRLNDAQRAILGDLGRAAQHWFESWRRQKLLAESVELGNMLFENPVSGLMLIDQAYQIRDVNTQGLAMLGYERRQLIGQPLTAVLIEHERPCSGGNSLSIAGDLRECSLVRKDGFQFPAETYAIAVNRGYLVVVRDVTDRHRRERLLRQHSLAIEQSFAGVLICDLDGTIIDANKAAVKMSGYAKAELIGSNQRMLESPSVPEADYESIRQTVRSGRRYSGIIYSRNKEGTDYAQLVKISPIVMEDGTVSSVLIVSEDITEKQRLHTELEQHRNHLEDLVAQRTAELARAKRAAEEASRAKSDFLASMSHEIRDADERCAGNRGGSSDVARPPAARTRGHHPRLRARTARHHRRSPRLLEDRGGTAAAQARTGQPVGPGGKRLRCAAAGRHGARRRPRRLRQPGLAADDRQRRSAASTDDEQPGRQRDQVQQRPRRAGSRFGPARTRRGGHVPA